jgi:iron complex outermembrane receptor protein
MAVFVLLHHKLYPPKRGIFCIWYILLVCITNATSRNAVICCDDACNSAFANSKVGLPITLSPLITFCSKTFTMKFLKLHHSFLLSTALMLVALPATAQHAVIRGKIIGLPKDSYPLVSLLQQSDSAIIMTTFADSLGLYLLDQVKAGTYLTQISQLGYADYFSDLLSIQASNDIIDLPDAILLPSSDALQEVQVRGRRPFVQQQIDRTIVHPDALIANAGTTAMEVLEKAPGVRVDQNGNISLKGRTGVMVLIDNKPTYLAATELADYLRSLPADNIAAIELMSNPPAGYDAAGNAGIINIKMKRNAEIGFNGGLTLSYGQGRYMRANNSAYVNYRINKLNLFSNIGVSENNTYQDLTINRYYFKPDGSNSSTFTQNSYIKAKLGGYNARIGFDYYLNDKSTLGAVASGFINPSQRSNNNKAIILNALNQLDTRVAAQTHSEQKWRNGTVNLNYTYKLDERGSELSANADYVSYKATQQQSLINRTFNPSYELLTHSQLDASLPAHIGIASAKIDWVQIISFLGKFDVGLKGSSVNTDNVANFNDVVDGQLQPNYEFSNRFKYDESIAAGYFNYAKDWKQVSLQLGLRLEHTAIKGHQMGNAIVADSSFTRTYTSLFPTLYFSYRADTLQRHQFGLAIGRRVERPDYQDLNPFTYPMDRYTYYGGNPFLQPTFSYNVALSHIYKGILTTTFEYSIINNLINETNEQRGNIYYSRPGNFGWQRLYGLTLNGNFQLATWCSLFIYAEAKHVNIDTKIYDQTIKAQRWYAYIGPTVQFNITNGLSAELAGSYQTRVLSGQFLTIPVWQARAALAQKFWNGNASLRFSISDVFYSNQPGGDIRNIANSRADWQSRLDSRVAMLSFSYRFNKGKTLSVRSSGASDSEKGRVRAG